MLCLFTFAVLLNEKLIKAYLSPKSKKKYYINAHAVCYCITTQKPFMHLMKMDFILIYLCIVLKNKLHANQSSVKN